MQIIDSHTHIYAQDFEGDIEDLMQRASDAKVEQMILPNIDLASYPRMLELVKRYPERLFPTLGLHPTDVKEDYQTVLSTMEAELGKEPFVAIGEIGLDYYWDTSFKAEQIEAFHKQISWAKAQDLPIIIHTRDAFEDTFKVLREENAPNLRGVFHSFTGTEAELNEVLTFENFYVGLNGVVTFKNSNLKDYIKDIPLERLLIETDAPYLSPVPKRGKRNEPAHLQYTLHFLAELWGISAEALAEQTTANAKKLFGI